MSDESSMTAYSGQAFADVCEEIRSLKVVVPKVTISRLELERGEAEREIASLKAERDQARADCEKQRALRCAAEVFLQEAQARCVEMYKALEYSQLALESLAPNREEGDMAFAAYEQNKRLLTK